MNMTPAGNRVEFFGGLCSIKGCDLPELAAGFCNKHWRRLRKYGSPLWLANPSGSYRGLPAEVRFFKRVIKTDACWDWQGGLDKDGYGVFMGEVLETVLRRAHRFSWSFHNNRTLLPAWRFCIRVITPSVLTQSIFLWEHLLTISTISGKKAEV